MMDIIQMVDLKGQYNKIQLEIDTVVLEAIRSASFINGPSVHEFQKSLENFLSVSHVIPCANGTDALQIALMALGLERGDEVIVPAFTYVATAEVIALLQLTPVWVDVDEKTFCISPEAIEQSITSKTKAIVPVHLYGQCANMEKIMQIANENGLFVVEDNAQAIGATYQFKNGTKAKAGTIGHVGCTSFFPSKNLGCYGDGGAMYTNDEGIAESLRIIANHGQRKKYVHEVVGVNSRLDTLQAAILNVKLKYLNSYIEARQKAAEIYDTQLKDIKEVEIPFRVNNSTHVFHQYTIKVKDGKRDALKEYLESKDIPTMIYYPIPMHQQPAYISSKYSLGDFPVSESLAKTVLSLPMHTELETNVQEYIIEEIKQFFKNN